MTDDIRPTSAATENPDPETPDERTTAKAILIATVAAIGGFLFGFDTAVINGAVDAITSDFTLGPFLSGFAVSCALLGSAFGAWYAGAIADRFGRVKAMLLASFLFAISAIGSGIAFTVWDLIFWRFVGGIGVGMASVIAPAYIAEISPAHIRGRLGSLQQLAIVSGIFVALLSDAFLANAAGSADAELWLGADAWRWMFIVGVVPAVIYGVLALTVPESPRYLVAQGDERKAADVLRDVLGSVNLQAAQDKVKEIASSLSQERKPELRDMRGPSFGLAPIVWIGILLSVFQQFVGINVIFYYSTTLWRSVGFSESDSLTITVITSVTNIVVTLVAIAIVDKVGRKPMLLIGSAGMALTLATMAVCFSQAIGDADAVKLPDPWGNIALVAANLYVVFFGATWGPVVWVLLGEMFPNKFRAIALSVAAAAQWLANFAITTTFPVIADVSLTLAYGMYAGFAVLSFAFVARAVRETKGVELEAMEE